MLMRSALHQPRFADYPVIDRFEQAVATMHDQVLGRSLHDVPFDRILLHHRLQLGRGVGGRHDGNSGLLRERFEDRCLVGIIEFAAAGCDDQLGGLRLGAHDAGSGQRYRGRRSKRSDRLAARNRAAEILN
jgi:hypothetical protein